MGITLLKIFIWGGISSDIRSEIMFYKISERISDDIPPQMIILNTVFPLLTHISQESFFMGH